MKGEKFTFNSLILVVILITGIFFFFSVKVVEVAEHTAEFEFIPIEGTDLSVCYSNLRTNGIYSGDRVTGELVVPGDFGHDWGAAAEDGVIYINEYTRTSLNLMKCRIAKIEIDGFRKSVYMDDAMLRGRCASGELVLLSGFLMPSGYPKTNPLLMLYGMSSPTVRTDEDGGLVSFVDPKTGSVLYSVWADSNLIDRFDEVFLSRTLEEVKG